jgi:hypothetical protein
MDSGMPEKSAELREIIMSDPNTTTVKIRGKLSKLRDSLAAAEKEFDAAWKKHAISHSRDDKQAMMDAYKKAMKLHAEYKAEYNRLKVREFTKLEGVQS